MASGRDVFLEIDVQGALQVKSKMPEGIYIFLTLPDLANLRDRLVGRGTDSADVIEKRVAAARDELKMMINYDYAVENDVVSNAVERIKSIITAERLRVTRVFDKIQ